MNLHSLLVVSLVAPRHSKLGTPAYEQLLAAAHCRAYLVRLSFTNALLTSWLHDYSGHVDVLRTALRSEGSNYKIFVDYFCCLAVFSTIDGDLTWDALLASR